MLKEIREMINKKSEFVESATIIFEDVLDTPIEELIILESDPLIDEDIDDENIGMGDSPVEPEVPPTDTTPDDIGGEPEIPGGDIPTGDLGGDTSPVEEPPMDLPSPDVVDDLPTPVGAQTGEPVADDLNNILTASIDLQSNTMSDILPVPPQGAGGAVMDDILDSRIDSGFGDDATPAPAPDPATPPEPMADDILDEPIEEEGPEVEDFTMDLGEDGTYDIIQKHLDAEVTFESAKEHFKAVFGFMKINKFLTESGEGTLQIPLTNESSLKTEMLTTEGNDFLMKHYKEFCTESTKLPTFTEKINLLFRYWTKFNESTKPVTKPVSSDLMEKYNYSLTKDEKGMLVEYTNLMSKKAEGLVWTEADESRVAAIKSELPSGPNGESVDIVLESITLAGEAPPAAPPPAEAPAAPPPAEPAPAADIPPVDPAAEPPLEEPPMDLPPDDPAMAIDPVPEESDVTTAVRDKLDEADTPDSGLSGNVRDDILDQLDKLNKEVLNAKEKVKKALG